MAELLPVPEASINYGSPLMVALNACNPTAQPAALEVAASLPEGWTDKSAPGAYTVPPGACYPIQALPTPPAAGRAEWVQLHWAARAAGHPAGQVDLRVWVTPSGGMPQ